MKTSTELIRDMVEMVKRNYWASTKPKTEQGQDVIIFSKKDGNFVKVGYGPIFAPQFGDAGDYVTTGFVLSYSDKMGADVFIRDWGTSETINFPNGGFIYDDIDMLVEDIVDFLGVGANEQTA